MTSQAPVVVVTGAGAEPAAPAPPHGGVRPGVRRRDKVVETWGTINA